ncbi:hypothetical protein IC620_06630 [Hazenella sp. IB182357]|uniref:Uncharacterized protein n=1 Tax=Polycladospora coralii TaxID=2771432 RepID=A0A926N5S1_9BACL|nr:hypothetical protein [Polycladospora coralii]MBD1372034.1 hypothetical protein [Polycladospora coralii]
MTDEKIPQWKPWMPRKWKARYVRGEPERFTAQMSVGSSVRNTDMIHYNGALYRIISIQQIINRRSIVEIEGVWQRLSEEEYCIHEYEQRINYSVTGVRS